MGERTEGIGGARLSKRLRMTARFSSKYPWCEFSAVNVGRHGNVQISFRWQEFWQVIREEGALDAVQSWVSNPDDPANRLTYLWEEGDNLTLSATGPEDARERLADLPRLQVVKPDPRPQKPDRPVEPPVVTRRRRR